MKEHEWERRPAIRSIYKTNESKMVWKEWKIEKEDYLFEIKDGYFFKKKKWWQILNVIYISKTLKLFFI